MGWAWWAGSPGENNYDIVCDAPSRDECIRLACRELAPGDTFAIVEAKQSQAARYEGADFVPFIRERNHEVLTVGPVTPVIGAEG